MIEVTWKSTGAKCTSFRDVDSLARWLATAEDHVTRKVSSHPSVDLRDVYIPQWAYDAAIDALEAELLGGSYD